MVTTVFRTELKFLLLFWTTGLLPTQKVNGQHINDRSGPSVDSSYFFYQQSEYPRDCKEVHDQCSSSNSSGVYYIKPDGYFEPFEAFCDTTDDLSGWTVIMRRRIGGFISFIRDWDSYRDGFGFLAHEFWIGNERLSYLTNQKKYQLLIEATLQGGANVTMSYDNFRIGDNFSQYKLISISYSPGTPRPDIPWCPSNMVYGNCACGHRTCGNPSTCQNTCTDGQSNGCICPAGFYMDSSDCVPEQECGCYVTQERTIVEEGETYVNSDCTRIATCSGGQLTRNDIYECSPNAACGERGGERNCYCNDGYTGNGAICTRLTPLKDCMEVYDAGSTDSGVYTIKPTDWPGSQFEVFCNMTDGGGWTVFQRRIDGDVDFYRDWDSYKNGFGNVNDEHWLGNEQLYYLTNQGSYQLRVDLVNRYGAPYYAKFDSFRINAESDNYRLSVVGSYSGTADSQSRPTGYALSSSYHRNQQFSTKDRDNDAHMSVHCAQYHHGAWWYKKCYNSYSNLNADYHESARDGRSVYWSNLPGGPSNIKYTEMKIRPV